MGTPWKTLIGRLQFSNRILALSMVDFKARDWAPGEYDVRQHGNGEGDGMREVTYIH